MSEHAIGADHESETSIWPLIISVGILFFLPFAFSLHFVYNQPLLAMLSLGIGVPLIVMGIVGWVREALTGAPVVEGLILSAMGWFILAESLIFLTFFATYWVTRLGAPEWPPAGSVDMPKLLPAIMTLVLLSSSFTIYFGEAKFEQGDRHGFIKWLLITMLLGLAFISMSFYEWNHLFHQGFNPETNVYSSSFFSITGFHGAHVLVGLCIFMAMMLSALGGKVNEGLVKTGALYWHFVVIVWLFVVSQLYYWV